MSDPRFRRLAARVFNTPLLVTPEAAETVANILGERMGLEGFKVEAISGRGLLDDGGDSEQGYALDTDGIATIPVHGELVNRGSWMDAYSGLTSYDKLRGVLTEAAADPRVRGIVLDVDSPGGEAAGAFETAALVRSISKEKKVVAFVDSLAASAGYAIASGADEIVATPSATLGSIGVVYMHMDRSQAMKDKGFKATLLHAGAYKLDGNSLSPLPDDARERIQAQIDDVYSLFVETVGKHRPGLGSDGARKTEAGIFLGSRAVTAGLADRIGSRETLASAFPRTTSIGFRSKLNMADDLVHTQAALDAAVSTAVESARREGAAASQTAVEAARASARNEERERIKSILGSEAAKTKMTLARHLALSSDMTPEAAAGLLAAAAPEAAPAAAAEPGRLATSAPRIKIAADAPDEPELSDAEKGRRDFAAAFGKTAA